MSLLKVWVALVTIGTNDVSFWYNFMRYLLENDMVSIYRKIWYYNHPPFISLFLMALGRILDSNYQLFPLLIRLPAIIADFFSTLLVYGVASKFLSHQKSLICAFLVALSPISFQVSGFHGNTDAVFMCLLLLSGYLLQHKRFFGWAGLVFGLAINIKIVPIILLPFFFFFCPNWHNRAKFFMAAAIPVTVGFSHNLIIDPRGIINNVFLYTSEPKVWGFTNLIDAIPLHILNGVLNGIIVVSLVKICLVLSRQALRSKEANASRIFFKAFGLNFLIFLVFAPGFGVQYLSWLVLGSVFIGIRGALFLNILAGVFLFSVYTYWSTGFPWYYADATALEPWSGIPELLSYVVWLYLLGWLLVEIYLICRQPSQSKIPA